MLLNNNNNIYIYFFFPLVRNWELSNLVLRDVVHILSLGNKKNFIKKSHFSIYYDFIIIIINCSRQHSRRNIAGGSGKEEI